MRPSKRLQKDLRDERRIRARIERRIERETDAEVEAFCDRCTSSAPDPVGRPWIVAEGDSWFNYPPGIGVISRLETKLGTEILNLASPGDEVGDMMSGRQKKRLETVLRRGPRRGRDFDFLLLSGGGNDLVGKDRFHKWFHDYERGMTAEELLNDRAIGHALALLRMDYETAIAMRDAESQGTVLVVHGYDFVIPDGRGVCWLGPWMKPGLDLRRLPANATRLRRDVVRLFLERFLALLEELASENERIRVVPTQGTLDDEDWANELHPTNPGFGKIADRFVETIRGEG